ncbi:MAG: hypothetical protein LC687_03070, partial [Actinobacteria bacterium]|nr:hypothetical protein [Actinomycetota bacterium]
TNAGVDALVQSGWEGLQEVMTGMKQKLSAYEKTPPTQPAPPQPETPQAPERTPLTETPTPTQQSVSWDNDWKKVSEYFDKVERGDISPVLPKQ